MRADTRSWLAGLRDFAAEHAAGRPVVADRSAASQLAERSIIGAHLATRLADLRDLLDGRRGVATGDESVDPDPAIVLTTSGPGGVAAEAFLEAAGPAGAVLAGRLAISSELAYRLWCSQHPDPGYRFHVNAWSWVKTRVPPQRDAEFAAHPLRPGERYWLHRAGLAGAGQADHRVCHLWKFDGTRPTLLAAAITERTAGRLGDGD